MIVESVLGPDGSLARALPNWEERPQQLVMAHAIAGALADERSLLVEGGTGTGKTLAYLVPAILSGKRVIVSTATRTLQEQLATKDMPLLHGHLEFTSAVLKGISNYLCVRRFAEIGQTSDPDLLAIAAWARTTATGDRAELASVAEDSPAWRMTTTTPDARLGPRCPHFDRCFVTQARRAAAKADVIIVNHHLFVADAALRAIAPGAAVLPEHDAVIFDEAHALEEVATEHFGVAISPPRLAALLRDARHLFVDDAAPMLANLEARGEYVFALIRTRIAPLIGAGPLFSVSHDVGTRVHLPGDLFAPATTRDAWFRLDAALEELAAHATRRAPESFDEEAHHALARRAQTLRDDFATLAEPAAGQVDKHVRWGEVRGKSLHLHASPVDVGRLIRDNILTRVSSAIFTSATLTAGGNFDYLRERLGLDDGIADEIAVGSPFDYSRQALLYLPRDLPLPDEPDFLAAAAERVAELCEITGGRAFVLTTSWRSLRFLAAAVRDRVPFPVLVQGEAPRATLLDEFRAKSTPTAGAVLIATSSFWEGVDVPGAALSLVVLEKLPFGPPDDPLAQARSTRLAERGEDPFARYHLPRAAVSLKQGFGRLIRRRDDRGIVAVLDARILARAYGRVFLATLPPVPRTSVLEQVRRWW